MILKNGKNYCLQNNNEDIEMYLDEMTNVYYLIKEFLFGLNAFKIFPTSTEVKNKR
jgi:hypothetical protein